MVMDRQVKGYYDLMNQIRFSDGTFSTLPDQTFVNGYRLNDTFIDLPPLPPDPRPDKFFPSLSGTPDGEFQEDCDFSDVVLKYINQILMEEDMEDKACMFQESAALQAAEKSFYDVIGEKYPPSPDHHPVPYVDQNGKSLNEHSFGDYGSYNSSNITTSGTVCPSWNHDHNEYESLNSRSASVDLSLVSNSQSSHCSSSSSNSGVEGLVDSPVSVIRIPDVLSDSQSVEQFIRGAEEASKFLPNDNRLFVDLGNNGGLVGRKENTQNMVFKEEKEYESETSAYGSRGKKKPHPSDIDLEEGRRIKQSAVYTETTVRSKMFDMVLLCNGGQGDSALREALQNGVSKNHEQDGESKGSNGGKGRRRKQRGKKNVIDLRTLLTLCAQAVAANDRRSANDLLEQIRQHSSPTGDGMQRMAHYFADGLEARMAGSGTQTSKALIMWPTSAASVLRAYHLFLAACPYKKISNFFSNKTIMNVSEKATTLHVVDFGILYGFQWPCLIQRLSCRPGGPPKLRITGIDFPHPGFRPAERVDETGRRLANYAESFNVPFEFNAIAQKWETIQLEDLKINKDEVLVVNCQYRFRNLLDETVVVESPRNIVLDLIRKMNPDVYIQAIVNGTYNAPFFITRFREALFHYSSLFDMLETNIPREIDERMLLEKEIFGREVINVIACEGAQRIERPETYKQWHVRNLRAGFVPLPLEHEIMKMAKDRVKSCYHKDFVIDQDGHWMLQGWKGRIDYALSSWRPAN